MLQQLASFNIIPPRIKLDEFVDRLCYRYTPMLLALFMFITGTVDYLGKPISCMLPNEYSEAWVNYVHQLLLRFPYITTSGSPLSSSPRHC
uniref:Innexin n=1 Tax=Globodera pallida TaxID=36090 RepID=A0A183BHP9_GLOPA